MFSIIIVHVINYICVTDGCENPGATILLLKPDRIKCLLHVCVAICNYVMLVTQISIVCVFFNSLDQKIFAVI